MLAEKGFSDAFGNLELSRDMPAIKYIMDTRQAIFTGDVLNSEAATCVPHGCAMNSLICAPINISGEVCGIIYLDSVKKGAFTDEDFEFTNLLACEIAITIRRSFLYSRILDISIRDSLTGCLNRRKFDVDIAAGVAVSQISNHPLSLLMLDIDHFKNYNDFHGHPKGDKLLQKLVSTLSSRIRAGDTLYRYGGEEFSVLLTDTDKEIAIATANRLKEIIEHEPFEGEKESQPGGKVTISIGVANYPLDALTRGSLLKAADSALYDAKKAGRNQVRSFQKTA
ncbi:MAG: sensor domain-containing diguanylate cyclase [Chloroflexi bacterium]|nr:sensor domain-containing diguanylate cyclase [Chloroflexota bacterium]